MAPAQQSLSAGSLLNRTSVPYSLFPISFPPAKNRAIISAISFHFAHSRAISFRPIAVSS
jgi:hypothetical protein